MKKKIIKIGLIQSKVSDNLKLNLEKTLKMVEKAAKDEFKGKLRPAGNSFVYRPAAERNVESDFKSGGTGGKTSMGGV